MVDNFFNNRMLRMLFRERYAYKSNVYTVYAAAAVE